MDFLFRQSCKQQVQEYFINQIRSGDLQAGEKLPPEIDLAQSFSVSRNTLREALKSLEAIGVLEIRRGKGSFVALDARKRISDMELLRYLPFENAYSAVLEAKNALEPEVARLAALRRTEEDILEMKTILETPIDSNFSLESVFQTCVASAAKSQVLFGYIRSVYQQLLETEYPKLLLQLHISDLRVDQSRIFEAIVRGDEEWAYQVAKQTADKRYRQLCDHQRLDCETPEQENIPEKRNSVFLCVPADE